MGGTEIASLRAEITTGGLTLTVSLLRPDEVAGLSWAGDANHLRYVAQALARPAAEVDYLALRAPNGAPICIGGIDYARHVGAGTFWQLNTRPDLRSLGLGSLLLAAGEKRICARGLHQAVLGVEKGNLRARALYERLGYREYRRVAENWEAQGADDKPRNYRTIVCEMRKRLT